VSEDGRAASDKATEAVLEEIKADPSITDRVRESILGAIVEGRLQPGSLHSVQTLANAFGVSRTPVREALIDLSGQGVVKFERNRGVRILQTSVHDLEEILALRLLLEVPATHRAVENESPGLVEGLKGELAQMEAAAAAGDEMTMMRHDRRFHELINEASGNARLASYVDGLRDLVLTRGVSTVGRSRDLPEIVAEHTAVIEAIEAGDPDAAAARMKEHLVNTGRLLLAQESGGLDPGLSWADLVTG
jgi:DNA-binding GntR family transcriptional regulator